MNRLLNSAAPAALLGALLALGGCAEYVNGPWVHKIDIDQGNVITQEMVNNLRPGMTKAQVRYALGSPMLVDVFHQERWDYLYMHRSGNDEWEKRRVSLHFRDELLAGLEGDFRPLPKDATTGERMVSEESALTVPEGASKPKEKGFFQGMWQSLFGEAEPQRVETRIEGAGTEGDGAAEAAPPTETSTN